MSNSETPTSNGHPSALSPREQAANDKLAALLMECAISVKRGERTSIVRQTIHGLNTWYKQGGESASTTSAAAAVPASAAASATNSTVTKPTKPPHAFGMLGKMVGLGGESVVHDPKRSQASKDATSAKNAARVRAELNVGGSGAAVGRDTSTGNSAVTPSNGNTTSTPTHPPSRFAGHHDQDDWCDVHFTMGCHCKSTARSRDNKMSSPPAAAAAGMSVGSSGETSSVAAATTAGASSGKPSFQRPVNAKSPLIANGWIEQQRRSKMRTVWKDVLVSLVEARKPTEETTLWIQREVADASGKSVLEALHQIPIKWLEEIIYVDFSADHRFTLKVYNLQEEFVFRCARDDEAAQNWVLTLRSAQEIAQKAAAKSRGEQRKQGYEEEKKLPDKQQQQQHPNQPSQYPSQAQGPPSRSAPSASSSQSPPPRVSVKELRAIAHGVGVNTYGMERVDLERIVEQVMQQQNGGPPPHTPGSAPAAAAAAATAGRPEPPGRTPPTDNSRARAASAAPEQSQSQNTAQYSRSSSDPQKSNSNDEDPAEKVEERRRKMAEVEARRKTAEAAALQEKQHRQKMEERAAAQEEAKRKAAQEEHGRRLAESVKEQQEAERRRRQDEERKQMEEDRRKRDEDDHRRRVAEQQAAEQRRREEEARLNQQAQWQQQQQNWQKQQAEDEQRKRAAEQQAAEERRRQEETFRRQQQQQQHWHQQQQQQQHQQQQWQQQNPPQQPGYHTPNQQFYGSSPAAAPQGPPRGQQAPPHAQQQPSGVNQKYAKMAHQTDDDSQMTIHAIKHGILVEWALQPPTLQALRPIEVLMTTIHKVFPPKFGVPGHAHFAKWKPITPSEVSQGQAMGNRVDDEKLKKAIKKLRFFLHPDKLPHEFNSEQLYICKMLWDITSDASEEHKKKEEDLGWIRG
jgi:hypothetical protein